VVNKVGWARPAPRARTALECAAPFPGAVRDPGLSRRRRALAASSTVRPTDPRRLVLARRRPTTSMVAHRRRPRGCVASCCAAASTPPNVADAIARVRPWARRRLGGVEIGSRGARTAATPPLPERRTGSGRVAHRRRSLRPERGRAERLGRRRPPPAVSVPPPPPVTRGRYLGPPARGPPGSVASVSSVGARARRTLVPGAVSSKRFHTSPGATGVPFPSTPTSSPATPGGRTPVKPSPPPLRAPRDPAAPQARGPHPHRLAQNQQRARQALLTPRMGKSDVIAERARGSTASPPRPSALLGSAAG